MEQTKSVWSILRTEKGKPRLQSLLRKKPIFNAQNMENASKELYGNENFIFVNDMRI